MKRIYKFGKYMYGYCGTITDHEGRQWQGTIVRIFETANFGWCILKDNCPLNNGRIIKLG